MNLQTPNRKSAGATPRPKGQARWKGEAMNKFTRAMKLSLCALALGADAAADAGAPVITNITMVGSTPQFGVHSDLGITNQVQYCTNLTQGWWLALTNLVVAESPYWFVDVGAPPSPQRFYRTRVVGPTPSGMVLIPAGSFTMGNCMATNEGDADELPLHPVYVSAFYMDRYKVSKALWDEVKAWNGGNGYSYENVGAGKAADHPVQRVNWRDGVKWCNARSQMEGLMACYYNEAGLTTVYKTGTGTPYPKWDANGYRLPTEAEWEKAVRGGASGHRFPWGDDITHSRANYYSDANFAYDTSPTRGWHPTFDTGGYPYTSPVGYFAAYGYGLCDLEGNVREWCWDWYSSTYYRSSPGNNPIGPSSGDLGTFRVSRGGSWVNFARDARCADRVYNGPVLADYSIGFRCVRGL
jgi:formylglycine-generating enzyme